MAVTVTNQSNPLAAKMVQDTAATNTAADNTTGASGTLYMVEIDNTGLGASVYFKLANATTATVGTTAASMVLWPMTSRIADSAEWRSVSLGSSTLKR